MGKSRNLEEWEEYLYGPYPCTIDNVLELGDALSFLLDLSEEDGRMTAKNVAKVMSAPLRRKRPAFSENKTYLPIAKSYFTPLVDYLIDRNYIEAELARKIKTMANFAIEKGRVDARSEFIHHIVHTNEIGRLSEQPFTYVDGAIERFFNISGELGLEINSIRTVSETYRDYARTVAVSPAGIYRSYSKDNNPSRKVKTMVPTIIS